MQPSDDLLPQRSWDELVATSRRRGQRLRLHRRLAIGTPLMALSAALLALPLLWSHGTGPDRLVIQDADRPTVQAVEPTPTPSRAPSSFAPRPAPDTSPSVADGRDGAAASTRARQPRLPSLLKDGQRRPKAGLPSVTFEDQAGDADTRDGALGAGAINDDTRDIVSMTFARQSDGIQITMRLAAARAEDSLFYGYVTDPRSGCELSVFLGSSEDEGFYARCGDVSSDYLRVPRTADPSPTELVTVIPYELVPDVVDVRGDLTGLWGSSWTHHLGNPEARVDTAHTTRALRRAP